MFFPLYFSAVGGVEPSSVGVIAAPAADDRSPQIGEVEAPVIEAVEVFNMVVHHPS